MAINFGGSVVCKVLTVSREISPTYSSPNFRSGPKMRNLASVKTSLKFEQIAFGNAARYSNSETKMQWCYNRPMFWPSVVKLALYTPEKALSVVTRPLKLHAKTCLIVDKSTVDYSISLTLFTEIWGSSWAEVYSSSRRH